MDSTEVTFHNSLSKKMFKKIFRKLHLSPVFTVFPLPYPLPTLLTLDWLVALFEVLAYNKPWVERQANEGYSSDCLIYLHLPRQPRQKGCVCKFLFCYIIWHVKNRNIMQIIWSIVADLCIRRRVGLRMMLKDSLTCQVQGQGSNHQPSDHCNDNLTTYSQTSRTCWWQGGCHGWAVMLDNLVSFVG